MDQMLALQNPLAKRFFDSYAKRTRGITKYDWAQADHEAQSLVDDVLRYQAPLSWRRAEKILKRGQRKLGEEITGVIGVLGLPPMTSFSTYEIN